MAPLLSVVIPTKGRESLRETLASIPREPWVEVVVVADGRPTFEWAAEFAPGPVIQEDESCWGHPQRNAGMKHAAGRWLAFIDDDDLYTPQAFLAFRSAIARNTSYFLRPRPTIFRMTYDWKDCILWNERQVALCNVGTPMILTPNDPTKLAIWPHKRTGDFDFIRETVAAFGGCDFDETIVCTVRRLEREPG